MPRTTTKKKSTRKRTKKAQKVEAANKIEDSTPWQFKRMPEENRPDQPFDCVLTLRMDKELREQIRSKPNWQVKVRSLLRELVEKEAQDQIDKMSA